MSDFELERVSNRKKLFLLHCDQFKYVLAEYGDLTEKWSARGKWKNEISDLRSTIDYLVTYKFIDEYNFTNWSYSKGSFCLEMGDVSLEGSLKGYPKSGTFFIKNCSTLQILCQVVKLAAFIYMHDLENETLESIRYLFYCE